MPRPPARLLGEENTLPSPAPSKRKSCGSTATPSPKLYAELEAQGIIETIHGKGYFLRQNHSPFSQQVRLQLLQREIDEAVVMAHHLQVDREKFLGLVRERLDYFERKSAAQGDGNH